MRNLSENTLLTIDEDQMHEYRALGRSQICNILSDFSYGTHSYDVSDFDYLHDLLCTIPPREFKIVMTEASLFAKRHTILIRSRMVQLAERKLMNSIKSNSDRTETYRSELLKQKYHFFELLSIHARNDSEKSIYIQKEGLHYGSDFA